MAADHSYTQRVFDLYLKRNREELLGFGYHHYMQMSRGVVTLSCRYRDLFFGKGFHPDQTYRALNQVERNDRDLQGAIASYDPETEIVVHLNVQNSDLNCFSRLSKKGLALSVIHRQYLNRLLDFVAIPGMISS